MEGISTVYLRKNAVRWLVVPNLNPYGYSTNSRGNVNTVNLNRNADYHWDDYYQAGVGHADYKGDAVWSEKEARIMRDLVEAHPEALAYIDFHNFSSTGTRGVFLCTFRGWCERLGCLW